jgi:hypothetical protein
VSEALAQQLERAARASRALSAMLAARLALPAQQSLSAALDECARGPSTERFCALLALASRWSRVRALAPSEVERADARALLAGLEIERWNTLETARVALVLARPQLGENAAIEQLEAAFRSADEGEACALYRSLCLLPRPELARLRAAEGCRSNMRSVFEAIACDNPYPCAHFDELAWRQLVIKSLFVGAPTLRIVGLEDRLSPELARMALDLADERRSAGRPVPPGLWLCLGAHAGERGRAALALELERGEPIGQRAAAIALARAGAQDLVRARRAALADERLRADLAHVLSASMGRELLPALGLR